MKNEMKKWAALALAATTMMLAGCVKEINNEGAEAGTPILFGASTQWENNDLKETRTEYSGRDEDNNLVSFGSQYERIDWVGGKDMIRVVCEAASGGTVLGGIGDDYVLGTPTASGEKSTAEISPKEGDGLQWGTGDHYFYALYPAPGTESNYSFTDNNPVTNANAQITASSNTATVTGIIPAVQEAILESGTTTYKPNMNYAYMYAANKVNANSISGSTTLSFQPLVTTLEFTLKNDAALPMTENLTRVELRSASTPLTGSFSAALSNDADPVITTGGTTGNTITIDLPSTGIELSETTPVQFTFLTLPVDQTKMTLVLYFGSDHSVTRSLDLKDASLITSENQEGWVTVDACKKAYITNMAVPGGNLWVYTFDVTGNYSTSIPMAGGDVNYTVKSYRTSTQNSSIKQPVVWTTLYSENGNEWVTDKPEWLQSFTMTGPGSIASPWEADAATLPANTDPMEWQGETTPVATTQAAARDLSCYDIYGNFTGGTEGTTPYNTANCYVVGAPGWYRIPCVYGNAIKNGADNPSSYTGPTSGDNLITGGFMNHAEAHITSPWIKDNKSGTDADSPNIVIDGATLVWQDHIGLITDINYDSDYLYFKVSETDIYQGNAVIAVKAGSTIVWSWHIWVVENPETNLAAKTMYSHPTVNHSVQDPMLILPMDLGFCDTAPGAVRVRHVRIRFIQANSGYERTVTITQLGDVSYNVTYYQWGRKDPMPPAIVNFSTTGGLTTNSDKPLYDIDGSTVTRSAMAGRVSIGTGIQNPFTFVTTSGSLPATDGTKSNWTYRYDNLWNTNVTTQQNSAQDIFVCKTIYDPCPIGFKLPNMKAFTGFSKTGYSVPEGPNLTTTNTAIEDPSTFTTLLGYYFYVDINDHSKGTVFFPRTGSRSLANGNIGGLGIYADQTSATPTTSGPGSNSTASSSSYESLSYFTFAINYLSIFHSNRRAFGFPARPIGE